MRLKTKVNKKIARNNRWIIEWKKQNKMMINFTTRMETKMIMKNKK